jgi:hypothetical protein
VIEVKIVNVKYVDKDCPWKLQNYERKPIVLDTQKEKRNN